MSKQKIDNLLESILIIDGEEKLGILIDWCLGDTKDELARTIIDTLLRNIWSENKPLSVVIENEYIDKAYRDSYYIHFSSKHFEISRYCKRICLFEGAITDGTIKFIDINTKKLQEKFIGSVVFRPLNKGKIGKTLINPCYIKYLKEAYIRTAQYSVTILGKKLTVEAFPFSMQDGETTSCAEITILNILDYFSKYAEYRCLLPSDIVKITDNNYFERTLPTQGLRYEILTKVFSVSGFYPRLYNIAALKQASKFKRIFHYYVESGIPVAIGIKMEENTKHSVVCIGHGKINREILGEKVYSVKSNSKKNIWFSDTVDLVSEYIIMDDHKEPYCTYEWTVDNTKIFDSKMLFGGYEQEQIAVPLYKRMFLEAFDAYTIATKLFSSEDLGILNYLSKDVIETFEFGDDFTQKENPIVIRLFMTSARSFKSYRSNSISIECEGIRNLYIYTPLPRFIWVCELFTKTSYNENKVIGEIVIDATSAASDIVKSVIMIHYPMWFMARKRREELDEGYDFNKLDFWEPFPSYQDNLDNLKGN